MCKLTGAVMIIFILKTNLFCDHIVTSASVDTLHMCRFQRGRIYRYVQDLYIGKCIQLLLADRTLLLVSTEICMSIVDSTSGEG